MVICKRCGAKTAVIGSRINKLHPDEILRKHRCASEDCGIEFFTVQFPVEVNSSLMSQWDASSIKKKASQNE